MSGRDPASMSDAEIAQEMADIYARLDELEAEYEKRNDTDDDGHGGPI